MPQVVFLGLDAAEPALLDRWCAEGALPTLSALRESGLSGDTVNSPGLYTGSVWPSIHTGLEPGRHGRYFYRQLVPGTYRTAFFPADRLERPVVWRHLADAGRRVAVVDLPKTPFTSHHPGLLQVAEWGLHDPDGSFRTSPAPLAREIAARFGTDPVGRCDPAVADRRALRRLRDALLERIARKADLVRHLLARERWDVFAAAFGDSHCAGHQFWALHDPSHPRHDPALAGELGNPLRDVYAAIDAALGRILADVDREAQVVVLASHGMGPHYDGTFLLEEVLARLEGERPDPRAGWIAALRRLWQKVPRVVRARGMAVADAFYDAWLARSRAGHRCFVVPTNDNCAGIRVNVVGREPKGRVRPGAELDAFCRRLETELGRIVNLETGKPLVREVVRCAEAFPGERAGTLPDLLVRWERSAPVRRIRSGTIGTVVREYDGVRTGDHRNGGRFYARGPGFAPAGRSAPVRAVDFAPTIAALAGAPMTGTDGRVLEEAAPCA